jgi:WD40 repeat protein
MMRPSPSLIAAAALSVAVAVAIATTATGLAHDTARSATSGASTAEVSPPAGRVVYAEEGGLETSSLAGGRIRVLRPKQPRRAYWSPVWSPGGGRIAVSVQVGTAPVTTELMDASGRALARTSGRTLSGSWSPDRQKLALEALAGANPRGTAECNRLRGRQHWFHIVGGDGSLVRALPMLDERDLRARTNDEIDSVAWSPDGYMLAYAVVHWADCDTRGAVTPVGTTLSSPTSVATDAS